jgi:hypothetical protein
VQRARPKVPDDVAAFMKTGAAAIALADPGLADFLSGDRGAALTAGHAIEIATRLASDFEARHKARLEPLRRLLRSIDEASACARAAAAAVSAAQVIATADVYRRIATADATQDAVENIAATLTNSLAKDVDVVRCELSARLASEEADDTRAKPLARFIVWLLRHAVEADEEGLQPTQIKKFLDAHLPSQTLSWETIRKL